MEDRMQNNIQCPEPKKLIPELGHLMEDLSSICTCGTRYTKMCTLLWYTKAPLSQTIYESVAGTLEANNDRMSLVDRLDCLEDWTKHIAKG